VSNLGVGRGFEQDEREEKAGFCWNGDRDGRTHSHARMQRASRSSLHLKILSGIPTSATSLSLCLRRWKEQGQHVRWSSAMVSKWSLDGETGMH
jgi:hypothetical protein